MKQEKNYLDENFSELNGIYCECRNCDNDDLVMIELYVLLDVPMSSFEKVCSMINEINTELSDESFLIFNPLNNGRLSYVCAAKSNNKEKIIEKNAVSLLSIKISLENACYE